MRTLFSLSIVVAATTVARSSVIVSPTSFPNSSTPSPFFVTTNSGPSVRYQQLYSSSDFQGYGSFQLRVTGISFTAGSGGGPSQVRIPNVQISFSTTQKVPDGLGS